LAEANWQPQSRGIVQSISWSARKLLKLPSDPEIMGALTNERCTACRRDSPQVTEAEIRELKPQIPDWRLVQHEGIERLERVFTFNNFADALSFTNRVGALAEAERHHPAILTEGGRVTVTLWTHKIRGLHRNDFIMAAKVDSLTAEH
jgi:4a-hydroxytetrahydrobiopterin dehydratase